VTRRFVCIHGHFYQPPRETPGLGLVEPQPSAAPYRDWNERITAECYRPNARARLLDGQGRLRELVNNYDQLGFDFGPTLLRWLERNAPDAYSAIIAGDRASCRRFGGHGGALAHPYHHSILPLANSRDRTTEIRWGLVDFERRFGRPAEGMWLPETAVDIATLEELASQRVAFTVLAPKQARRVRSLDGGDWREVFDGTLDVRRPYRVCLPSGRSIDVFFYHGALSQGIAYERLLDSADRLVERVVGAFDVASKATSPETQLVSIATDGESYGHHHRFGDMALARTFELLGARKDIEITTYASFLARFPPQDEVELLSPSAWSCAHGVERWRSDCGCRTGGPEKNQRWREPLRSALDALRDASAENYETAVGVFLTDPWRARNSAVALLETRSEDQASAFLSEHSKRPLTPSERTTVLELIESQHQALAMFTSCAWFFDDVAGIETIQVLAHADRAIDLQRRALGVDLEPDFMRRMKAAIANDPKDGNGARLLVERVRPARGDLMRIARHAAMLALRDPIPKFEVCGHRVERVECASLGVGDASLSLGALKVTEQSSGRVLEYRHAVIETGRLSFSGGVAEDLDPTALGKIEAAFSQSTDEGVVAVERWFPASLPPCGLEWLMPADRERFVEQAFVGDLRDLGTIERRIAEGCAKIADRLESLGISFPAALSRVLAARDTNAIASAVASDRRELRRVLERAAVRATGSDAGPSGVGRLVVRLVDEIRRAVPLDDGGERIREVTELIRAAFRWRADLGLHDLQEVTLLEMSPHTERLSTLARDDAFARARLEAWRELAATVRVDVEADA
jgi:alpha-amylase/alpha-mannosidase (GH57 family)